jgi:peptide/nickel transport system substrate-binding protein
LIVKPWSFQAAVFNKKQGIFSDLKMRQAVQAAMDFQPMMRAAFGDPRFYRLDPGLFPQETKWWSNAGKALYNENNPTRAKQLLQEAGYRGQTVRILTTHEYEFMYKLAVVLKNQLEAVGLHAALDVVDWATLTQRRTDPSAYEIYMNGFTLVADPIQPTYWDTASPGWWVNPRKDSLMQQLSTESDEMKRLNLVSQLQQLWYDDVPALKIGDMFALHIKSKKVVGDGLNTPMPYVFNSWLSK